MKEKNKKILIRMSDFGDMGGAAGLTGYQYQTLLALHFLVVKEAREIEWESDGEDITLINEDSSRESIEYIQAKYRESGSFTLTEFRKIVFPQLWKAYCDATMKYPDKFIKSTLITNIAWDHDLKIFIDACKKLRNRGITLQDFGRLVGTIKTKYDAIKKGKDPEELRRFLFGLNVIQPFTCNQIEQEIISYLKSCGIIEVRSKIRQMLQLIMEKRQGVITRRQIEDIAGKPLSPITTTKSETTYTTSDVKKILTTLNEARRKFGTTSEMPDKERRFREIVRPAESALKILTTILSNGSSNITIPSSDRHEFQEIVSSDAQKAREDAESIADLEVQLWTRKKRYTQRMDSLKNIANYVKMDESEGS